MQTLKGSTIFIREFINKVTIYVYIPISYIFDQVSCNYLLYSIVLSSLSVFFFAYYLRVSLVLFLYSLYFSRKLRVIVKQREFKCE